MANAFSIVSGDLFESSLLGYMRGQVRKASTFVRFLKLFVYLFGVSCYLCFVRLVFFLVSRPRG